MRKKRWLWAAAALMLCVGAAAFFGTHEWIDCGFFPKNADVYDLRGHTLTAQEVDEIQKKHPNSTVLWTVYFQGKHYAPDTREVRVTALTQEEARELNRLPELAHVDGTQCPDTQVLAYLQTLRPECRVEYSVNLGNHSFDAHAKTLTVSNVSAQELEQALPMLPQLRELTLEGTLPSLEELLALRRAFPKVALNCTPQLWGEARSTAETVLDLTGTAVKPKELIQVLPLMIHLEEVRLTGTGLTEEECKSLADQFPEIFFLYELRFAGQRFLTDSTEIDISGIQVTPEETEAVLPYFPRLKKLIMSDCGIDNDTMDAMNLRHPDVKLVWTVMISTLPVRTDEIYFFPVVRGVIPNNEQMKNLRYCRDMIALDIGHFSATECDWLYSMPHLKYLILAENKITDLTPLSSLKELIYLELFDMPITDYSPLLECTALQDLNISMTYGDPEPLSKMTWLHNLMWYKGVENPRIREAVQKLPQQLPDTIVTLETTHNIGAPWRYLPNYYVFRDIIGGAFLNQTLTIHYWGEDKDAIMDCANTDAFAGDVLADMVKYRMEHDLPIPGIRNIGSEKEKVLYETLRNSRPWGNGGSV